MHVIPHAPTNKGIPEKFTGDVWIDVLTRGEGQLPVRMSLVRFTPGARISWHTHVHGQLLYITEGRGFVQSRGEAPIEVRTGDLVYTPPGEWHWHGAAPDTAMSHFAIFLGGDDEHPDAEWGGYVTDEEYAACTSLEAAR
ncbi:cupin domain-containing protein [Microbacterium sp. X-17]|uniref:(R)-mandelonitrile lyase n=1 Tax=Microbacterium sp. X-17 TaxID=3144404 RepID=UPI0031F5D0D7